MRIRSFRIISSVRQEVEPFVRSSQNGRNRVHLDTSHYCSTAAASLRRLDRERHLRVCEPKGLARCHARSLQSSSIGNITVNREALEPVDLIVGVKFISRWPLETAVGGFLLETVMREPVWRMNCQFSRDESQISGAARQVLRCEWRGMPITPGEGVLSAGPGDRQEGCDFKLDISNAEKPIGPLRPSASEAGDVGRPAVWEAPC